MTAASDLTLRVISPEGVIFEANQLFNVVIPLVDGGSIGIRPKHAPLIAETVTGSVRYQSQAGEEVLDTLAGVLEVRDNIVTILTAGSIEESDAEFSQSPETVYDRLIETLVNDLSMDQVSEEGSVQ